MTIALAVMVTALALASLVVSVYALLTAHKLFHAAKVITHTVRAESAAVVETAQSRFNAMAQELQTVKSEAPPEILPGMPKPGMNLSRRSLALRLHRKGSSPEHIAASIDVPRQEVELLIKVHEIVLNNL
jgi:hypothetical protein